MAAPASARHHRSWLGHRRAGPGAGLPSRLHEAPAGRGSPGQRKESRARLARDIVQVGLAEGLTLLVYINDKTLTIEHTIDVLY